MQVRQAAVVGVVAVALGGIQAVAAVIAPPVGHVDAADERDVLVDHDLLLMVAEEAVQAGARVRMGICSGGEDAFRARRFRTQGFIDRVEYLDGLGGVGRHVRIARPGQHIDFERRLGLRSLEQSVVEAQTRLQHHIPVDLPTQHVDRLFSLADRRREFLEVFLASDQRLNVVAVGHRVRV